MKLIKAEPVLSHVQISMTDFYLDDYGYTGSITFVISERWELNKYKETTFNDKGISYYNRAGISYYAYRKYGLWRHEQNFNMKSMFSILI